MVTPPKTEIENGYPVSDYIPWQISLQVYFNSRKWTHICGATILDEMTIMTASYCYNYHCYNSKCRIVAGVNDLFHPAGQVKYKLVNFSQN